MAMIRTCDNCGKEISPTAYVQIMDYGVGGEGGGTTELCPDCAAPAINLKQVKDGLKKDRVRRTPRQPGQERVGVEDAP